MHPNRAAPSDSATLDSARHAGYDRSAYTVWLQQLREVCSARGIVLIFDEVFMGFRLAPGGAQEYFGVRADLVTYGKTLGGGFPVGVVCGKAGLMKRFREDRPADLCFARGTFNAHPYVIGAMQVFLEQLETPAIQALYADQEARWNQRCAELNRLLAQADLPVQATNMLSVWTLSYTKPSRYNWMLQYYLREQGLALSWVGTGRLIFSLNYTDSDCDAVFERIVAAARQMVSDGWWWSGNTESNRDIRRSVFREMLVQKWRPLDPRHPS
jgi:glutamate-1-semialdehyde 2,1-aminomutase